MIVGALVGYFLAAHYSQRFRNSGQANHHRDWLCPVAVTFYREFVK